MDERIKRIGRRRNGYKEKRIYFSGREIWIEGKRKERWKGILLWKNCIEKERIMDGGKRKGNENRIRKMDEKDLRRWGNEKRDWKEGWKDN